VANGNKIPGQTFAEDAFGPSVTLDKLQHVRASLEDEAEIDWRFASWVQRGGLVGVAIGQIPFKSQRTKTTNRS